MYGRVGSPEALMDDAPCVSPENRSRRVMCWSRKWRTRSRDMIMCVCNINNILPVLVQFVFILPLCSVQVGIFCHVRILSCKNSYVDTFLDQ